MLLSLLSYRGAVRPPFIEGLSKHIAQQPTMSIGGQSAPPSLKEAVLTLSCKPRISYRGAVRPPFIEGLQGSGASVGEGRLSGGSPPPLH